ncbi:sensor histidine kinase [Streptomyces axinellae]|uniref:histidine kinase n=1 Tax=Streptomyces axinellae TaxID=552788 RepID=A0ABN3QC80_9ACTN
MSRSRPHQLAAASGVPDGTPSGLPGGAASGLPGDAAPPVPGGTPPPGVRSAWQALAQHPLRFVASPWPWRSLAYLVSGAAFGAVVLAGYVVVVPVGLLSLVCVVGALFLLAAVLAGGAVCRVERRRLRLVDPDPISDPHRPPARSGPRAWLRHRLSEPATWRELGFTLVSLSALWWIDALVLAFALGVPVVVGTLPLGDPDYWPLTPLGLILLATAPYPLTAWAGARATLTRMLLMPRDAELREVHASRTRLLDAFDSERRRIERDLHDGAQQRLVSVNVMLGVARLDTPREGQTERRIAEAQAELAVAVDELRELSRGLHPKALTDHGLAAAVDNLTSRAPVPATVDITLPHRLPTATETTAYFAIAEALANVTKHSGASSVRIHGRLRADAVSLSVTDDGAGGADPERGSGLTGLADRVAATGGTLRLSSPLGGPTMLHVELPCR